MRTTLAKRKVPSEETPHIFYPACPFVLGLSVTLLLRASPNFLIRNVTHASAGLPFVLGQGVTLSLRGNTVT